MFTVKGDTMADTELVARELIETRHLVPGETPIKRMLDWFKGNPEVGWVAVADGPQVVGVVGREQLSARLSGPYGFATMADKTIHKVAVGPPLLVPGDTPVSKMAARLAADKRGAAEWHCDLVITEGGAFAGLVSLQRLFVELTRLIGAPQDGPTGIEDASDLAGSIASFAPIDLVQFLVHGRMSGELRIRRPSGEEARVYLREGGFTHAVSGLKQGLHVLRKILGWTEGRFVFTRNIIVPLVSIEGDAMEVLLAACAHHDEQQEQQAIEA